MKITLSSAAIRAQIQALVALKATIGPVDMPVLTADSDFALNQRIVSHFLRALISVSSAIIEHSVNPDDYMSDPMADIILTVDFNPGRADTSPSLVRGHIENYIADAVLADIFASTSSFESQIHNSRAGKSLSQLVDSLMLPDLGNLRISRTI